jgi:hypothetical protein
MAVFAFLRRNVERRLYKRGFVQPVVRQLLCTQVLVTGAALLCGLFLFPFTLWPLAFGLGALIATYSLWQIVRFAQVALPQQFSIAMGFRLGLGFTMRLLLIGMALFALIVPLRAPVAPLLLGLGSAVAGIVLWGMAKAFRKPLKEA